MNIPRIMIAAAGSGSGKTLLSCALMMLFSQEGKSVSAIKCGPDYIDPMFHRTVLGVPSRNLDTFFTGERLTKSLFARAAEGADLAVMEGVMGLYDGLGWNPQGGIVLPSGRGDEDTCDSGGERTWNGAFHSAGHKGLSGL